jgi:hypothetical protein
VFPKQGHYAFDPKILAENPAADIEIANIGDLLNCDFTAFLKKRQARAMAEKPVNAPTSTALASTPTAGEASMADFRAILIVAASRFGNRSIAPGLEQFF